MADSKYSLVDFGSMAKPIADVACKLIDKLSDVAGYIFPPSDARKAKSKAHALIIMEMAEDKNLDPIERGAKISSYNKDIKEYKNQSEIITGAIPFLKEDAEPEKMDEDWVLFFMDKVRLVSDEELQLIWSRILAQEANACGTVSKQLMHILTQMCRKDAEEFMKLIPFCAEFYYGLDDDYEFAPIVPDLGLGKRETLGFGLTEILTLESYGLIKYSNTLFACVGNDIKIKYDNKTLISFEGKKEIQTGCLSYTSAGIQLFKLCEKVYDESSCKIISDYLNNMNTFKIEIVE